MNKELRNRLVTYLKERGYNRVFSANREDGFVTKVYGLLIKPFPESWNMAKTLITTETSISNDTIFELKEMVK